MKKTFGDMLLRIGLIPLMLLALVATSCELDDDQIPVVRPVPVEDLSVYVISSGGFGKATAVLDLYSPSTKTLTPQIFNTVNGVRLGDTAQSGIVYGDDLYIVVNNSNVIYKLDAKTSKRTGQMVVTGPRYVYIVNAEKGYISHLGSGDITIFNPKTMTITGKISTYQSTSGETRKDYLSTEKWVKVNSQYVMVSCWSNHDKVLLIDTTQDKVVKEITVGLQPNSMDIDKHGKVWVLCEGQSWANPPVQPSLWTIDTKADYAATKVADVPKITEGTELKWPNTTHLRMNLDRDAFYFINAPHIFKMNITDKAVPTVPIIKMPANANLYSLKVAPNGDLYFADAKDGMSNGTVYRYSASHRHLDTFTSGVWTIDYVFYVRK